MKTSLETGFNELAICPPKLVERADGSCHSSPLQALFQLEAVRQLGGVLPFVDEFLKRCSELDLNVLISDESVSVSNAGHSSSTWRMPADFRKRVFRAMLARLYAMTDERSPESVSPYGGEGTLVDRLGNEFRIRFKNEQGIQELDLVSELRQ